jgi:signal transduction histidine kinase
MAGVEYDAPEASTIHRTVDSAAESAADGAEIRRAADMGLRGSLVDLALGAMAPVAAAVAVGITISLTASVLWMLADGDDAVVKTQVAAWVARIQGAAPLGTLLFTFAAAFWASRRSERRAPLRGVFMTLGASVVGTGIGILFGARPDRVMLLFSGAVLGAAQLGILLGTARAAEQRALRDATQAMRAARTLDDVVAAAARLQGARDRVRVALLVARPDPPSRVASRLVAIADTQRDRVAEIALDATPRLAELLRADTNRSATTLQHGDLTRQERSSLKRLGIDAALWMRLRSVDGTPAVLLVAAASERRLRRRWLGAWLSVAVHVELAWQNLELMERDRATALRRERERLSDAIHDTLAQDLVGAVMHLEAAAASARASTPALGEQLDQALRSTRESLAQARRLVWASRRPGAPGPLEDVLAAAVHGWERQSGVAVDYDCAEAPPALAEEAQALVLRAAREALANVKKHAEARTVSVRLLSRDGRVRLEVDDDGIGWSRAGASAGAGASSGYGLHSLAEDAARLGGALEVTRGDGPGTRLSLELPTRREPRA